MTDLSMVDASKLRYSPYLRAIVPQSSQLNQAGCTHLGKPFDGPHTIYRKVSYFQRVIDLTWCRWSYKNGSFAQWRRSKCVGRHPEQMQEIEIPYSFQGLPLVPHSLNGPSDPPEPPSLLTFATSVPISDQIQAEHLTALQGFFDCRIVTLDFFIDRYIYLYFRERDFYRALTNYPEGCFCAWGATFLFVQLIAGLKHQPPDRV